MRAALPLIAALFAAACGAPSGQDETAARGQTASAAVLEVRDGWAAPTPGGVTVSAGYVTIENPTGAADTLLAASSPRAERVEVHEMSMDGGVMRMRAVEGGGLAIPAGAAITLAPGGHHLMFYGVTQPFAEGDTIPLTLTFANAGEIALELPVRRDGAAGRSEH
jgi:copper(I)-binding protein